VRFPVPGIPRQSASKDVVESGIVACGRFAVLGKTCRLCAVVMAFSFGMRRVWGGIIRMLRLQLSAKYFANENKSFYHTADSMEDLQRRNHPSQNQMPLKSREKVPDLARIWLARMYDAGGLFLNAGRQRLASRA
jgi:hypothetical protein